MRKWVWLAAYLFFRGVPLMWLERTVHMLGRIIDVLPLSYKAAVELNKMRIGLPFYGEYPEAIGRSFVWYLAELFAFHRIPAIQVTVERESCLRDMLGGTKSAIMVTGHIGNWELGAQVLSRYGFDISGIALRHGSSLIDAVFDRQRRRSAVKVIPLGHSARRRALEVLKSGKILGIVGDLDFSGHTHAVRVGKGMLRFPTGPALLSWESKSALVPMFFVREGAWRFRVCIGEPIDPCEYADRKTAVPKMVEAFAREFERVLFRYPEQWLAFEALVEEI